VVKGVSTELLYASSATPAPNTLRRRPDWTMRPAADDFATVLVEAGAEVAVVTGVETAAIGLMVVLTAGMT